MQQLIGTWADVLASGVILAALAACAALFVRRDQRLSRTAPPAIDLDVPADVPVPAPNRPAADREWDLVIGHATRGLERQAALLTLQGETAQKIAAAEHAYNRLVADCAKLRPTSASPTVWSPHEFAAGPSRSPRAPGRPAERPPLAA